MFSSSFSMSSKAERVSLTMMVVRQQCLVLTHKLSELFLELHM